MTQEVRCPYCITAGFGFRAMTRQTENDYVCLKCGHIFSPDSPDKPGVLCTCARCRRISSILPRLTDLAARSH